MAAESVAARAWQSPSLQELAACLDLVPAQVFAMQPAREAGAAVVDLVYV